MRRAIQAPLVIWMALLLLLPLPGCSLPPLHRCRAEGWSPPRTPVRLVPEPYVPAPYDANEAVHLAIREDLRSQSSVRVSQVYYFNECDQGDLTRVGATTVIGLLENDGPTYLQLGRLLIDFKDSTGRVLGTEEVSFPTSVFAPGAHMSFDAWAIHSNGGAATPSAKWTSLDIRVLANPVVASEAERVAQRAPSAALVTDGLTMTVEEYATGDLYSMITGTVTSTIQFSGYYSVSVALFDARGELVGSGHTFHSQSDPPFNLLVPIVRGPADHFEVYYLP